MKTLDEYHNALRNFDWQFEFSDEHAKWAKGHNNLMRLYAMQKELDIDGTIWLSYPGSKTHGAPQPRILTKEIV